MSALAHEIGDHPVLLPLLDRLEAQGQQLCAAESTANQHGDHSVVTQLTAVDGIAQSSSRSALLWRQPISESNADPPRPFSLAGYPPPGRDSGDRRRQPRTPRAEPWRAEGDRGRRIPALFEVNPVPEHVGAVECKAGLRTIPDDELANGVIVGSLAAGGRQVFEVRERQNALRRLLLARLRLRHRRRPPSPWPTASSTLHPRGVDRYRPPI
jgi:hypothetical protein